MENLIDITDIVQKVAVFIVCGGLGWVFNTVRRNRKDMNCMFRKVRRLYKAQFGDEWEKHWDD